MSLHRAMSDPGVTPGHQPRMSRPSPVSLDREPAPPLQLSLNFTTINPESDQAGRYKETENVYKSVQIKGLSNDLLTM